MDPAHSSSPEAHLELIEKTMQEYEACIVMAAMELQQAITSQAEGLAVIMSQVQQIMVAFTTVPPLCMNIVFVMDKQWKLQNSNKKTHLRFRS